MEVHIQKVTLPIEWRAEANNEGNTTDKFDEKTVVRYAFCYLLSFSWNPIQWGLRTATEGRQNDIQCTLWGKLDDLDFADDVAVLSHNQKQMQEKIHL